MTSSTDTAMTRRQVLVAGGTFAGHAMGVETVLAQAIKTDTQGLVAGDQQVPVAGVNVPVYEARPATGKDHPIILVISEVWGATSTSGTPPAASPRPASTPSRPISISARATPPRSPTSRRS
jgi:hypothetical protein